MKKLILFFLCLSFIARPLVISGQAITDTKTSNQVIHTQQVYKTIDTFRLKVDVFYTDETLKKENNTAIVFFHGGGWAYGSPQEFFTTCERYARMGIVAISVDYRLSADQGVIPSRKISPIECVMDARSAMRWVRENAGKLHIDRNKIVASGQSAGGQLALSTAMIDDYNEKSDNMDISPRPDALLLFSACVNTVEGWCDLLLGDRRNKIWSISPTHNMKPGLPPMIEFHGLDDEQVPKWTVQYFETEMKKLGNYFELHTYEGRKHYLGEGNPKYTRYFDDEILMITDNFLRKFKLLE